MALHWQGRGLGPVKKSRLAQFVRTCKPQSLKASQVLLLIPPLGFTPSSLTPLADASACPPPPPRRERRRPRRRGRTGRPNWRRRGRPPAAPLPPATGCCSPYSVYISSRSRSTRPSALSSPARARRPCRLRRDPVGPVVSCASPSALSSPARARRPCRLLREPVGPVVSGASPSALSSPARARRPCLLRREPVGACSLPRCSSNSTTLIKGDFDFCLDHIGVNYHGLLGDLLDQANEELCVAFAFAKQMEVTKRIKRLMKGKNPESPTPQVNPLDLYRKYKKIIGDHPRGGMAALILMALILKEQGILNKSKTFIYKASNVSVIPEKEPARIVAALADGFPLHAGIIYGKKLLQLRYCCRYKAPRLRRAIQKMDMGRFKSIPLHSVLLVGAGRKRGKLYYYFMNSWKKFAVRKNHRGEVIGQGIGKISADRLFRNVIRLSRFKEAHTSESLLHQVLPVTVNCHNVGLLVP